MYYRHDLPYEYPERCDEHMITVKHLRDVVLDEQYPYLQKSFWFKCQRGFLRFCQYTVLPLVMWVRHGLRICTSTTYLPRQSRGSRRRLITSRRPYRVSIPKIPPTTQIMTQ